MIRQPPIFPGRLQPSIVGRVSLNHRVRDGYGCFPDAHRHRKYEYFAVLCFVLFVPFDSDCSTLELCSRVQDIRPMPHPSSGLRRASSPLPSLAFGAVLIDT